MLNKFKESSHLNSEILRQEIAISQEIVDSKEFNDLISYYEKYFVNCKVDEYSVVIGDYFYGHGQLLSDRFGDNINLVCDDMKFTDYFAKSVIERPLPLSRERIELFGKNISKEEKMKLALHDIMWAARVYAELMMLKKLAQFNV